MSKKVVRKQFRLGELVRWSSQAGGVFKTKTGPVVEVVAPGDRPTLPHGSKGWGGPRTHESYVVRVENAGRRGNTSECFWPVVSLLEPAHTADGTVLVRTTKNTVNTEFVREVIEKVQKQIPQPSRPSDMMFNNAVPLPTKETA